MLNRIIEILVKKIYGKSLREEAQKRSDKNDTDAGRYAAARYTRGNIAIQQGRFTNGTPKL